MKQLFPKEFISSTIEHYTFHLNSRSKAIYRIIIVAFSIVLISLPYIKVGVVSSATGMIDTKMKRYELRAPVHGKLVEYRVNENRRVTSGDTLMLFDRSLIDAELNQVQIRIGDIDLLTNDLEQLIGGNHKLKAIRSSTFNIDLNRYLIALEKLEVNSRAIKRVYDRQKRLFDQKVIAASEFEKDEVKLRLSITEIELFKKQAINSWKEKALILEEERKDLAFRKDQLANEGQKYVLISPSRGELLNTRPLSVNQFIEAGIIVAELTPDTTLVANCWLSPKDIGLLYAGMNGSFRVDTFNPNDWGFLSGTISEISSDAYLIDNRPYFKVECTLNKDHLTLKNGFIRKVKKGMTVQANFHIAQRSLYQLLYDKVNNWLNPKI